MAAELKVKKVAKMVHREKAQDSGRKKTIPCACGGVMVWAKVGASMKYVCETCSLVCSA